MRIFILILFTFSLFCSCQSTGQKSRKGGFDIAKKGINIDSANLEVWNSLEALFQQNSSLSMSEKMTSNAKLFLQTPYLGGTLEGDKESLIINLRELDCTTFVENVLAIANLDTVNVYSFANSLQQIRYRKGVCDDYSSRLHYFSDWILDNEKIHLLRNITSEIGGVIYPKHINFMTSHISAYPALKKDSSLVEKIRDREDFLNSKKRFFIPEEDLRKLENKIQNGDIIAITTSIKGLDVSHVGIAIYVNDRLHLLHASSRAKKVVVSDIPLQDMLMNNRRQTGVFVVRPN